MGGGSRGSRPSYASGGGVNRSLSEYPTSPVAGVKRAFISFHVADEAQGNLLRSQAKEGRTDLEFIDYSVKDPFDDHWRERCTERLLRSSVIIVMIGPETHTREAVLWEINKAYALGKPVIGVRIYRDQNHTIPLPLIQNNARIMDWETAEIQRAIDNI